MAEKTTLTIQPWMKWLGGLLIGYLPVLFGGYLAFHDLHRDYSSHEASWETEKVALKERIVKLEEEAHNDDVLQERMSADLTYISQTMTRVEATMTRLATQ